MANITIDQLTQTNDVSDDGEIAVYQNGKTLKARVSTVGDTVYAQNRSNYFLSPGDMVDYSMIVTLAKGSWIATEDMMLAYKDSGVDASFPISILNGASVTPANMGIFVLQGAYSHYAGSSTSTTQTYMRMFCPAGTTFTNDKTLYAAPLTNAYRDGTEISTTAKPSSAPTANLTIYLYGNASSAISIYAQITSTIRGYKIYLKNSSGSSQFFSLKQFTTSYSYSNGTTTKSSSYTQKAQTKTLATGASVKISSKTVTSLSGYTISSISFPSFQVEYASLPTYSTFFEADT